MEVTELSMRAVSKMIGDHPIALTDRPPLMEEAVVVVKEISWTNVLKARDHISISGYIFIFWTQA